MSFAYFLIVGCGSSVPIDLFGPSATGSGVAGHDSVSAVMAGASAGAGQAAAGSGGSGGSASGQSDLTTGGVAVAKSDAGESALDGGGGSSASDQSDLPCSPFLDGEGGMTGPFGTTGAVCYRVSADIMGWGCSNFEGRTVKVNNVMVRCADVPLPDKIDGDYYFDVSAGDHEYASLYWY